MVSTRRVLDFQARPTAAARREKALSGWDFRRKVQNALDFHSGAVSVYLARGPWEQVTRPVDHSPGSGSLMNPADPSIFLSELYVLAELPRTGSGKIDRDRLHWQAAAGGAEL